MTSLDHSPHGPDERLVEVSPVTRTVHHAGAALETAKDRKAQRKDVERAPIVLHHPEYDGIDTVTPDGNYATRSNIVDAGAR